MYLYLVIIVMRWEYKVCRPALFFKTSSEIPFLGKVVVEIKTDEGPAPTVHHSYPPSSIPVCLIICLTAIHAFPSVITRYFIVNMKWRERMKGLRIGCLSENSRVC